MASVMIDDPTRPRCAFCKRWLGNANLTNRGVVKGRIKFESSAKGMCTAKGNHIQKTAGSGTNCRDYVISPEADRFI